MWGEVSPESPSHRVLWCTKVIYTKNLECVSRIFLDGPQLWKQENGEWVICSTFATEEERVEAIEREFGVKLNKQEQEGIKHSAVTLQLLPAVEKSWMKSRM